MEIIDANIDYKVIGKRVKEARMKANMTQQTLGEMIEDENNPFDDSIESMDREQLAYELLNCEKLSEKDKKEILDLIKYKNEIKNKGE